MKIQKYKKLKDNRYEIITDEKKFIIYDDVLLKYNLLLKKEITSKELDKILDENNEVMGYYKALKYLSIKMRSNKEIIDYLKKLELDKNVIDKTVEKLQKNGYINDKMYLKSYINDQILLTHNGPYLIKNKLIQMNISEQEIDEYLWEINVDTWEEKLSKIIALKTKFKLKESVYLFKNKLYKYLYNLGYQKELIERQIDNLKFDDNDTLNKEYTKLIMKYQKKYDKDKLIYFVKQKLLLKGYSSEQINEVMKKES